MPCFIFLIKIIHRKVQCDIFYIRLRIFFQYQNIFWVYGFPMVGGSNLLCFRLVLKILKTQNERLLSEGGSQNAMVSVVSPAASSPVIVSVSPSYPRVTRGRKKWREGIWYLVRKFCDLIVQAATKNKLGKKEANKSLYIGTFSQITLSKLRIVSYRHSKSSFRFIAKCTDVSCLDIWTAQNIEIALHFGYT